MRIVRRVAAWLLAGALALAILLCLVNAGLALALFGGAEGARRMVVDWRRIWVAHDATQPGVSPEAAFARLYGPALGPKPEARDILDHVSADFEVGEPAVFDVVMADYIYARFGAIDGRTLPVGVYLAAGPIGPDRWPGPLVTHYLVFPRHGYLLVVPPKRNGGWPEAYEATASLRKDFRASGDKDALYAAIQTYRPGAYDFPRPGEPVHDLLLISADPAVIADIEARLGRFRERVDKQRLPYRLLRRNSNSTLACYLHAAGLADIVAPRIESRLLLRLRLPGVAMRDRLPC